LLKFVVSAPVKDQADFTFVFENAADRDGVQDVVGKLVVIAPLAVVSSASSAASSSAALAPPVAPVRRQYESAPVRAVREASHAGGEARRRAAALAGDMDVKTLYEELVKTGVVAEEEFWALRDAEMDKQRADVLAQNPGPPAMLVGEVRLTLVKPGELHYRLTAAMIRQIFAENVAVRRAYEDNVPHKRSEEEFWREYLQSRYVEAAGPRVIKSTTAGDIFAVAEADMEAERRQQARQLPAPVAMSLDLRDAEGENVQALDADCLEPSSVAAVGVAATAEALVTRFNRHSQLVLERAGNGAENDAPEEYGLRLATKPKPLLLHLSDVHDGAGGVMPMEIGEEERHLVSPEELQELAAVLNASKSSAVWQPYPFSVSHEEEQKLAARRAAFAAKVAHSSDETSKLWSRAHELLRHYWGCFPVTSPRTASKARKMRDALNQLRPLLAEEPLASSMGPAIDHAIKHANSLK
jgi:hypothetical protein